MGEHTHHHDQDTTPISLSVNNTIKANATTV